MSRETRSVSSSGGEKGVKPEVFDQVPYDALMELGRVYGFGAAKYDAHNFRRGYEWSKSFNALIRHAFAWNNREDLDPESGLHHMAHVAWHAFNLIQLAQDHPEFDDRYQAEPALRPEGYEPSFPLPPLDTEAYLASPNVTWVDEPDEVDEEETPEWVVRMMRWQDIPLNFGIKAFREHRTIPAEEDSQAWAEGMGLT